MGGKFEKNLVRLKKNKKLIAISVYGLKSYKRAFCITNQRKRFYYKYKL